MKVHRGRNWADNDAAATTIIIIIIIISTMSYSVHEFVVLEQDLE